MRGNNAGNSNEDYKLVRGDGFFVAGGLLTTPFGDGCGVGASASPFDEHAGSGAGMAGTFDGDGYGEHRNKDGGG